MLRKVSLGLFVVLAACGSARVIQRTQAGGVIELSGDRGKAMEQANQEMAASLRPEQLHHRARGRRSGRHGHLHSRRHQRHASTPRATVERRRTIRRRRVRPARAPRPRGVFTTSAMAQVVRRPVPPSVVVRRLRVVRPRAIRTVALRRRLRPPVVVTSFERGTRSGPFFLGAVLLRATTRPSSTGRSRSNRRRRPWLETLRVTCWCCRS